MSLPPLSRKDFLSRYSSPSLPYLTEKEAVSYATTSTHHPDHIYPSDPTIFNRNLALLDHYTFVAPSVLVPGEFGLFTNIPIFTGRSRLFIGMYTGLLYTRDHPPSSSSRPLQTTVSHSLHLHGDWFIQGRIPDMGTHNTRLCVLSYANEWIWDPSSNPLQFGSHGCVYIRPHQHIPSQTELTIFYGEDYQGWDPYKRSLLNDLQSLLLRHTRRHNQTYWSFLLEAGFTTLRT